MLQFVKPSVIKFVDPMIYYFQKDPITLKDLKPKETKLIGSVVF